MKNEAYSKRIIELYKYLKEMASSKVKVCTNISDEKDNFFFVDDLGLQAKYAVLYSRDRTDEDPNDDKTLLTMSKPAFESAPLVPLCLIDWIKNDTSDFNSEYSVAKSQTNSRGGEIPFSAARNRVGEEETFRKRWLSWSKRQKDVEAARRLFAKLFNWHAELDRDPEGYEFVAANGFISVDGTNICYPVIARRLLIELDAKSNIFYVRDSDDCSFMNNLLLGNDGFSFTDKSCLGALRDELENSDYHPFDRIETKAFLKRMANSLSPDSIFIDEHEDRNFGYGDKLSIEFRPVFILRKRVSGVLRAIDEIVEDISENEIVPPQLLEMLGENEIKMDEPEFDDSLTKRLSDSCGEDSEILFVKPANREQLNIARRLEYHNAVLVQGPPGTGKTHTIANLIGNYLAQGKKILVTSQKPKALSVLKGQMPVELQSLCVSMITDSNEDMERSVDGISEHLASFTAYELKHKIDESKKKRIATLNELKICRGQIFQMRNLEFQPIVYNGISESPYKVARFVAENSEKLSYIPGKTLPCDGFPFKPEDISALYASNRIIAADEEDELEHGLPSPKEVLLPEEVSAISLSIPSYEQLIFSILSEIGLDAYISFSPGRIIVRDSGKEFSLISIPDKSSLECLRENLGTLPEFSEWAVAAISDGKQGGGYKEKWLRLISSIIAACELREKTISEFTENDIIIPDGISLSALLKSVDKSIQKIGDGNSFGKLDRVLSTDVKLTRRITINGAPVDSYEDCALVKKYIELRMALCLTAKLWNDLLAAFGLPLFDELDCMEPENVAKRKIPEIEECLSWSDKFYEKTVPIIFRSGIDSGWLLHVDGLVSDREETKTIYERVKVLLPKLIDMAEALISLSDGKAILEERKLALRKKTENGSQICEKLFSSLSENNFEEYSKAYAEYIDVIGKSEALEKRKELLNTVRKFAPGWADAIEAHEGIHGLYTPPEDIESAWRWKQYERIIQDVTKTSYDELMSKCTFLEKKLRRETEELVKNSSWYHLVSRVDADNNMRIALNSWKQIVKRIGKGTGKQAPRLRVDARKLMVKCQDAVPVWILPMNKALENLKPGKNLFDVVIIDEASQSDISALSILYFGKKIIVVGDDKQVSPMAVGMDIDKISSLKKMYQINEWPAGALFDGKTSLYDIASQAYSPLMLTEHFRCMPEIIGYSNWLSYEGKIKVLTDSHGCPVLPSVVNYRVQNSARDDSAKINSREAIYIIALIRACIDQPEYKGMSFGVISMLGNEQSAFIQQKMVKYIDSTEIIGRKILCGDASNFQGDERDIVFLSLVDSNSIDGPARKVTEGTGDSTKQRYNVAASRAKKQMWVVHSFDKAKDLQNGDIRKGLLDYSEDPQKYIGMIHSIIEKSESPFEEAVARSLYSMGYRLEQQYAAGGYRIDIVVHCGNEKVAVECDGGEFHSSEDQLENDMIRQSVLERLGWEFIRIRGSEYYHNPERTMEWVKKKLGEHKIFQEPITGENTSRESDLLTRVKDIAEHYVSEWDANGGQEDNDEIISKVKNNSWSERFNKKPSAKANKFDEKLSAQASIAIAKKETDTSSEQEQMVISGYKSLPTKKSSIPQKHSQKKDESEPQKAKVDVTKWLESKDIPYVKKSRLSPLIWIVKDKTYDSVLCEFCKTNHIRIEDVENAYINNEVKPSWKITL